MGRPDWADLFIESLKEHGGNVKDAAKAAGIAYRTAYDLKLDDEEFAEQWCAARRIGKIELLAELEDSALARAARGWLEPAGWHKGKAGGAVRRYSDQLTMFMLRSHLPQRYNIVVGDLAGGAGVITAEQRAAQIRGYIQALDDSIPGEEGDDGE
ncbi:MAG: hypothetical protein GY856_36820 [bacterium]|nr:hypothetical protein [bacterium]